jgi:hypothetical protein
MDSERHSIALFEDSAHGVRLVGRSRDAELVELVRKRLVEERRSDLARLEGPGLRAVRCLAPDESD